MLTGYVQAAMRRAHYEILEEEKPYFGTIPGFEDVWAVGATPEGCREEL
jgi:predicted RNase H-like HicB family nuclease